MFDSVNLGGFPARDCSGLGRRAFLQAAAGAPLAALLGGKDLPASEYGAVRAKQVIFVWLWGAPSHLDTFDPKPHAPNTHRGPFSVIATRTPGVQFTELLPKLAARSDQFALVRSNRTTAPGHPDAGTLGLTGAVEAPTPVQPNFGAIIARQRGPGELPPFVALGRGIPCDVVRPVVGYGGGLWGKAYDPLLVSCSARGEVSIPSLDLLEELTPERLTDRRSLLTSLDTLRGQLEGPGSDDWQRTFRSAYGLLVSPEARQALDLSRESVTTQSAYGRTNFGQSCLLARRLVERGVPYVQVNWSQYVEAMTPRCDFGWDTHIYNFELLADRHCPMLDRALSALLDDLSERGLLESTLVVAMGEFGRTPRINGQAARDHWPNVYCSLWAGAGVPGGIVIGESDRLGQEPVTEPYFPRDVGATICDLAGITSQRRAELRVLTGSRVIPELL